MHFKKISLLAKRQWKENRKAYGIGVMAMAVILSLLFLLSWHFRNSFSGGTDKAIFLIGLFLGGGLFASSIFRDLAQSARGIWLLAVPASVIEKLILAVAASSIGYVLVYLAVFYGCQLAFGELVEEFKTQVGYTDLLKNKFYNFFFLFFNLQLVMLLGSMIFRKASFLKTVVIVILIFSISNTANIAFLGHLTGEATINGGGLFDYFQFVHADENVYVYLPIPLENILSIFFHYCFPAILFCITYLRFKEIEI